MQIYVDPLETTIKKEKEKRKKYLWVVSGFFDILSSMR